VFIATFYERGHLWFHVIYVRPLLIPSTSFGSRGKPFLQTTKAIPYTPKTCHEHERYQVRQMKRAESYDLFYLKKKDNLIPSR